MQDQFEMDEYLRQLSQVKGYCIICRILTPEIDRRHEISKCPRAHKWDFIRCKKAVTQRNGGRQWIKNYTACYLCGQPQSACANWAAKEKKAEGCQYRDLVMPAVWALWADLYVQGTRLSQDTETKDNVLGETRDRSRWEGNDRM